MKPDFSIGLYRWILPSISGALLLGVLLFLFPFASGYSTQNDPLGRAIWSAWTTTDPVGQDYGYCLFVPFLVAYFVYARSKQLARVPVRGNTKAIGLVIVSLLVFWIGSRVGKQFVGEVGLQLLLLGLILWMWGREVFRSLSFAWIFFAFVWPLPFMDWLVALPLRLVVSRLACQVLNLIGIQCIRHGTALYSAPSALLPEIGSRFRIDVIDPCSGVHSLLPLLMFSAAYSYLFLRRRWQQWTVFLSAIPLIIMGNVVRILLLVAGSLIWGSDFALGAVDHPSAYHEGCGIAVFGVVLGCEWLLALFLNRRPGGRGESSAVLSQTDISSPPKPPSAMSDESVPLWRNWAVVGLSGVMLIVVIISPVRYLAPEPGVVMHLPDKIEVPELKAAGLAGGVWYGFPAEVSEAELTMLPKDTEFARKNYEDLQGHRIFFSIVLSGLQQYTIHPPQVCLVAQGWKIGQEEDVPIPLSSGKSLVARCLHIQQDTADDESQTGVARALYFYWYVTDAMETPSQADRNLWSSWERLVHNRDHRWAYITAMAPLPRPDLGGVDEAETRRILMAFVGQAAPQVRKAEVRDLAR